MSTQNIYIARYGVREYPLEYFKGPFDMDINEEGQRQARELAAFLSDREIHVVLSSPFKRAVHTADIVCHSLHLPLYIEDGLTEWLTPSLVGEACYKPPSAKELKTTFKSIDNKYAPFHHPVFPETEEVLLTRMANVTYGLSKRYHGKNILLVSHAPCDLAIALALSGGTTAKHDLLPYPLGGVFQFKKATASPDDKSFSMILNGSTSHLTGEAKGGIQAWMLPCLEAKKEETKKKVGPIVVTAISPASSPSPSRASNKRPGSPMPLASSSKATAASSGMVSPSLSGGSKPSSATNTPTKGKGNGAMAPPLSPHLSPSKVLPPVPTVSESPPAKKQKTT